MMKGPSDNIRCFVIADDYRWHVLTNSIEEFHKYTLSYLALMNSSRKENHYYFKNIFLSTEEYDQILKQMRGQKHSPPNILSTKTPPKRDHLKLVD
jgi:hypothetical protein